MKFAIAILADYLILETRCFAVPEQNHSIWAVISFTVCGPYNNGIERIESVEEKEPVELILGVVAEDQGM